MTVDTVESPLLCEQCGVNPAVCRGRYETEGEDAVACDTCCGHGNEDGHCVMLHYLDDEDEHRDPEPEA